MLKVQDAIKLTQSRKTTVAGTSSILVGLIAGLVPDDIWKTCGESISQTSNPLFVSALVIIGLGLTVIGPSLAKPKD
jgi:hypothetical protein